MAASCLTHFVVETVVFGYYKMDKRNRIMDTIEVYMDPILRESTGLWVDLPSRTLAELDAHEIDRMAAVHACGKHDCYGTHCDIYFISIHCSPYHDFAATQVYNINPIRCTD